MYMTACGIHIRIRKCIFIYVCVIAYMLDAVFLLSFDAVRQTALLDSQHYSWSGEQFLLLPPQAALFVANAGTTCVGARVQCKWQRGAAPFFTTVTPHCAQ